MNIKALKEEINESINNLLNQYRKIFTKEEFLTIKKLQLIMNKTPITTLESLKEYENQFLPFFAKVWQLQLTDLNNYQIGDDFKFVITAPTVKASQYDFYSKKITSASLITSKHFGTFNNLHYGVVCSVDAQNLLQISNEDVHAIEADKKSPIAKQYYEIKKDSGIYCKKYFMSLKLPNQLENELMLQNVKVNKDFIISDNKAVYSDLTLLTHNTKMLGVIILEKATEEEINQATLLANKYNLKLYYLPIKIYYDKIGLKSNQNLQKNYLLNDLDTIEFILVNIEKFKTEYSNLIVETLYNKIRVKDEKTSDYLLIDLDLENVTIYLTNDNRYFKIDYSSSNYLYFIDNQLVQRSEFKQALTLNEHNLKR